MKIVHLTDSMEIGGAEKLIGLLCREQRRQGHHPSVHCLYRDGALGEELRAEGFKVTLDRAASFAAHERSIYLQLRQQRPDVLHCHNATATIVGAMPARLAGVKSVVATRHGLVAPPYSMRRELKFSLASRACDRVVAVCERARLNLREAPFAARAKIVRIYNAACEPCRQNTPLLAKSGFTLLHVGRLTPVKQQETLVQAFALAQAEVCNLRLWIVGDGPLRLSLEQLVQRLGISASVTFFGEQANVAPFFASADLFVMSSITEGVPISLLEAMSAGLPAVVTDVGGMAEVALLSEALTTAPPSNPAALASAICAVAQSQVQLPQLRDASRRCYLRNFTPERMADEYFRVYDGSSLHEAGY